MRPQQAQSVSASSAINTAMRAGSDKVSSSGRYMASRLPKRSNTERWETPARKATSPVFGILFFSPATLI
jgi:hypothetical protein